MRAAHAARRTGRSRSLVALTTAVPLVLLPLLGGTAAHAAEGDTYIDVDFSTFTPGADAPKGQQGWTGDGTTSVYDWALVANSDFPASGLDGAGTSLRYSNSLADEVNYGGVRQLSTATVDAAGIDESASYDTFQTSFTVASTTGGVQPGLNMSLGIDNGSGSRAGGIVGLRHVAEGLQVWLSWLPEGADPLDNTEWLNQATVVPADVPHQIDIVSHFEDATAPDYVDIYIDGVPALTGHTLVEYHAAMGTSEAPTANSVAFRTGPSAPGAAGVGYETVRPTSGQNTALDGQGFLFTNLSTMSYETFPPEPVLAPAPDPTPDAAIALPTTAVAADATFDVEIAGFAPGEEVYFTWYSEPIFGGWYVADENGVVRARLTLPAGLAAGAHTLQAVGVTSGFVAAAGFQVAAAPGTAAAAALPDTGASTEAPLFAALLALGLGAIAVTAATVRRRRLGSRI